MLPRARFPCFTSRGRRGALLPDQIPPEVSDRPRWLTPTELDVLADAEPDGWVLDGIFPRSDVALVVGRPEAGKTRWLCAMTIAVAAGLPFVGKETTQGKVAWIYLEHRWKNIRNALRCAATSQGIADWRTLPIIVLAATRRKVDEFWMQEIAETLDAENVSVIILDSLRRAFKHREGESDQVAESMGVLALLTSSNKRLAIGIHHTTKSGKDIRGSDEFRAASESVVILERPKKSPALTIEADHHAAPETQWLLTVDESDDHLNYLPRIAKAKRTKEQAPDIEAIVLQLRSEQPSATATAIAKASGVNKQVALATIARLKLTGAWDQNEGSSP